MNREEGWLPNPKTHRLMRGVLVGRSMRRGGLCYWLEEVRF